MSRATPAVAVCKPAAAPLSLPPVKRRRLKSIKDRASEGPFSEAQWRWFRFCEHLNGAKDHGVFVQVGRRIYVDEEAEARWIDAQQVAQ